MVQPNKNKRNPQCVGRKEREKERQIEKKKNKKNLTIIKYEREAMAGATTSIKAHRGK